MGIASGARDFQLGEFPFQALVGRKPTTNFYHFFRRRSVRPPKYDQNLRLYVNEQLLLTINCYPPPCSGKNIHQRALSKFVIRKQITMRKSPNIIITGTPGVGKTTHCEALAERTGLRHLSVNQIVKEKECHEGWDEKFMSWIVDEDKVNIFKCSAPINSHAGFVSCGIKGRRREKKKR